MNSKVRSKKIREELSQQTILVIGGAGFIGSHLVDALLEKRNKVVIMDNLFLGRIENIEILFLKKKIPLELLLLNTISALLSLSKSPIAVLKKELPGVV